ncbi:hypothetical protein NFI96_005671 [Prochilodus magdalenae]|nr:hypothetical protein NFI96_005671 [Prochilodus magdalenae]
MDISHTNDYRKVKEAILKKYEISAETYRQRSWAIDIWPDENVRLKELFAKLVKPEEHTVQQISEILILEQFMRMVGPDMAVWMKEHDPETAEEAARLAEVYISARKSTRGNRFGQWTSGPQIRGPLDLLKELWEGPQGKQKNVVQYVIQMRERLEQMTSLAQENLKKAQKNQKAWYDCTARERSLSPGQQVLLLLLTSENKLLAKWHGPYEVLRKTGEVTYEICMPERSKQKQIFHVNLLKEFHPRPEAVETHMYVRAVGEEEESTEQYFPTSSSSQAVDILHLQPFQRQQLKELLDPGLFQERPGYTNMVHHDITLTESAPARKKSYRIPERLLPALKQELDIMLSLGVIEPSTSSFAAAYLDDIVIFSKTWDDHCEHLKHVLGRIKDAGLTINPKKCALAKKKISYLGFVIGNGMIRPQLEKVEAIHSCSPPTTKKKVRSFLGLVGWYRRFIPNFSARASVLTDLTKTSAPNKVLWTEQCDEAFQDLKSALCGDSVLLSPDFDQPFILQTDASGVGLGAVLLQEVEGQRRPVAFLSRKMFPREQRYSTVEKECLAIKWALDSLRYYLLGRSFLLETDHRALQWLEKMRDSNARITRWYLCRPGASNQVADFLSRIPEGA